MMRLGCFLMVMVGWVAEAQPAPRAAAEASVRQALERYLSAVRRGDQAEVKRLMRPNAVRFSSGGTRLGGLVGRVGSRNWEQISYYIRQVEFLRPDAVHAVGVWRDASEGAQYATGVINCTLVEDGGEWKVASVQESLAQPVPVLDAAVSQRPVARDGEWEILFDGKSAAHWLTMTGGGDLGGAWRVKDGALTAIAGAASADLRSDRDYTLFEMKWEWMAAAGSNSGVKYRLFAADTVTFGPARYAAGWEYQMADDAGDSGARVDDRQKSGALYGVVAVSKPAARAAGEWNESRLVVLADHVEHWLNGVMTARYPVDVPFASPVSLQHHQSEVRFREIRIRRIGAGAR